MVAVIWTRHVPGELLLWYSSHAAALAAIALWQPFEGEDATIIETR
jgi:hypothetical protein